MITVKTIGGLANRMMSIYSAVAYSQKIHQELNIIWNRDLLLNAAFSDLFNPIHNVKIIENGLYLSGIYNKIRKLVPGAYTAFLHVKHKKVMFYNEVERIRSQYNPTSDYFDQLKNSPSLFIENCHFFYPPLSKKNILTPNDFVSNEVKSVTEKFTESTIGIHIRRTDLKESILHSPLALFIGAMQEESQKNPNTTFFVATDDPTIYDELDHQFKNKIIKYEGMGGRNTVQGIQTALVDMMCLSKTQKIYGSFASTFSQMASFINEVPLVILDRYKVH